MKRTILITAFLSFALTMGTSAYAGQGDAATSYSATDQYVEMIPDPRGDRVPSPGTTEGNNENPSKGSNPAVPGLEKLAASGPGGELAAAVALATAVAAEGTRGPRDGSRTSAGNGQQDREAESTGDPSPPPPLELNTETSSLGSILSGVTGSGLGLFLPLMLILTLAGVIGIRLADSGRGNS